MGVDGSNPSGATKMFNQKPGKMNYKSIAQSIEFDLNSGVYTYFPWLKNRLNAVMKRLYYLAFVINANHLTENEISILEENGYLN